MNNILFEFVEEMQFLKKYMKLQKESYSLYFKSSSVKEDLRLPISKIKQFNFNSYIISIYGAYENFIEKMMSEYLNKICSIVVNFSELPNEIQKNNLIKTMDILKKLDYPKYKHLKSSALVEILHKNMNENSPFLNIEAFKSHTANFRIGVIESYFSDVGINNLSRKIINYSPLKEYLDDKYHDYNNIQNDIIFSEIDYVCETRNQIAHGVQSIQLLGETVLNMHIDFFILFSESLVKLLNDHFFEIQFFLNKVNFKPLHVYQKNIICFNTNGIKLNINNKVLLKKEDVFPRFYNADIVEIRKDNRTVENIDCEDSINICMKITNEVNQRVNFAIIE
jgi:hypothetical protein